MSLICGVFLLFQKNFAAQYEGAKAPDPGPGPMVRAQTDF